MEIRWKLLALASEMLFLGKINWAKRGLMIEKIKLELKLEREE